MFYGFTEAEKAAESLQYSGPLEIFNSPAATTKSIEDLAAKTREKVLVNISISLICK